MKREPGMARAEGRQADRSLALTILALALLTPPILLIFDVPKLIFGVPVLHIYCYGVWLVAIVIGARLARRLQPGQTGSTSSAETAARD